MLLIVENGIRGGFSGVLGRRFVKANNKQMEDFDQNKPSNYIMYLDANNLYGWAMSQKLPYNDFQWEDDEDYYLDIPDGRGCIVECDLRYPRDAAEKTYKFPLAPVKASIKERQLSEYQKGLLETNNEKVGKAEKLILDLYKKDKYVVHHRLLKYYIQLGLIVEKVHRTISFNEKAWLKALY